MVRIRALRDAYGLTAEQVAERMAELGVPVDRNSLYNIERGAKKPSDRVLDAYARALGVNPLDVWRGPLRKPAETDGQAEIPPTSPVPQNTETQDGMSGIAELPLPHDGGDGGMVWRGYVERHAITDVGRKRDGVGRAMAAPEVELVTPEDVADWIARRAAEIDRTATSTARRQNTLKASLWTVHRSVASRGRSVYTAVHVAPGRVVDLCAEVVRADDRR